MKLIKTTILTAMVIGLYSPSQAEVVSYSGGFLKSGNGELISESMGCYFNNTYTYMPIDIPDGTVIKGITVYNHNLSSTQEKASVIIFKQYRDESPEILLNQNYDAASGYSSLFIPASKLSSVEPKEFLVLHRHSTTNSDQIGVCGTQVHYEIDLIFKSSFD